jgi:hypothetical protein
MKSSNFIDPLFILISCVMLVVFNYLDVLEQYVKFTYLILIVGYYLGKALNSYIQKLNFKKEEDYLS